MTEASRTAATDPLQQRYEAIERIYSERQWDVVARRSEELLLDLPNDPGHPLRQRVQLLLGHTYLYGYQDVATASGFYSRVQAATKEPVLLDIAALGLEQCASLARATAPSAAESAPEQPQEPSQEPAADPTIVTSGQAFPFSAEAVNPAPASSGTETAPAMPWLEQLGGVDPAAELLAEVIDEPELIEVAQANPAQAEELEVAVRDERPAAVEEHPAEPLTTLSPEEISELSKGLLRVVIR